VATSSVVLEVDGVSSGYGLAPVLRDLHLRVGAGEIVALLGPNGAGKTTTLLTLIGRLRPTAGTIRLDGEVIGGLATHRIARRGVGMVPEDRALIPSLTVSETFSLLKRPTIDPLELFPELRPLVGRRCGLLSGGEQQMVAVARAVATAPKLLLLDELSQGLAPMVVSRIMFMLREVADDRGIGVLIVEQHVKAVLEIADRGCVLVRGTVVLDEPADVMMSNIDVVEASYLGIDNKAASVT
jgi:branched-chain amino acid transport system ATP-binding protein